MWFAGLAYTVLGYHTMAVACNSLTKPAVKNQFTSAVKV